ncbi:hypothetical protein NDU88_001564 [Pleurodeles waltl]|uniref:C2H2-type domain-containing protein n=2 Tax=Pleurodeles waltl TaxID=8319 RepID=A0AAV7P4I2_PLEWA|nr:hypothetical protein NDU88_001564 [Pleurodeles waltl]
MILNPIVHSEKIDLASALIQKQQTQTLTLNIVGTLPILSPGCSGSSVGSPGKCKNAGKYICKHCGRDCFKPSVLEKHIRSHTGERPFPCTTCGIAFKTQSNLYKHRRTQTHVNNARLSSESDSSILEEGAKVLEVGGEQHLTQSSGHVTEKMSQFSERGSYLNERLTHLNENVDHLEPSKDSHIDDIRPEIENNIEGTLSTADASLVPECTQVALANPKAKGTTACLDNINPREPSVDPQSMQTTPTHYVKKMLQEQRFSTVSRQVQLQSQQVTSSEKPLECPASERKLKKCESTDSGYLSHSDSMDQQTWPSSPLHSLCEQNSEAEEQEQNDSGPEDTGLNLPQMQHSEKTSSFPLEKKQLEEHISKLISQNKAVVDNTQLDNVRPRKTVLSKQGSIDLPMPYTYKDSFHFDIKPLGSNRKNNYSLCSAKSTFNPLEKSKPLFFHSVPTQFSTTIDCVPVTRSNSLPFVESIRNVREQMGNSKFNFLQNKPIDVSFPSLLHRGQFATSLLDSHNSHPRALVRQSAVDHLPSNRATDYSPAEDCIEDRTNKEGSATQCPSISKKNSRKKLKMFSQEKWQMYGDETFKKMYQKNNQEKAKKRRDDKESHLNDLASLVSQLQVEGSQGGFRSQAHPKAPATSSLGSSQTAEQPDNCTQNVRETSQWTGQGSFRNLSMISPRLDPAHKARWNKTVSIQGQSCRASPGFSESLNVGALTLNIGRPKSPQPQQVRRQSMTNLTTPGTITQLHPNVQHSSLAGLNAQSITGLDHGSRTSSKGDTSHKAFSQCVQTICRLEESEYGGRSSVEPLKEGGKLPSERKKVKVDDLGQQNQLNTHSSASSAKVGESIDTVAEARLYAILSPLELSHYREETKENFNGITRCVDGLACEKTHSQLSDSPVSKNTKGSFDGAGRLISTSHLVSQHSEVAVEQSSILEKHQTPSELKHSACTVGREHNLQALVCPPFSPQQGVIQSTALQQCAFSPKYLLKLPAVEFLCTTGREEGKVSQALSVAVTGSSLNIKNGSIKLPPSSVFPPKHTEQSVIVQPIDERETFLTGFPSTSLAMSIITCMAYSSYCKSSSYRDKSKVTCLQHGGSGKTECVKECSKTNTDQPVVKSNQTFPCRSLDKGTFLLPPDHEKKYELTHCLLRANCLNLASPYLCSGKPSEDKQEEPVGRCNPYTLCAGSIRDRPLDPDSSSGHTKIPTENALEPCRPVGAPVSHLVTIQQGKSFYSGKCSTEANINFPSLNTEMRMTWCCLARNLSCTAELKKDSNQLIFSPHSCLEQSNVEKPNSSCRVTVLSAVNTISHSANNSATTNVANAQESLEESPEQQHKGNPDTFTNSANASDQTAKNGESGQTEPTSTTTRCGSKELEITKNGCRGKQLRGHTRFKVNRLHKNLLLPHKMTTMRKKQHLPKMHNGLQKSRKFSCHGNTLKKISRRRGVNENISVVPARPPSEEQQSEEDKYTTGPPAEPGHTHLTREAGPGRANPGGQELSHRSGVLTQLTCPISIEKTVRPHAADISRATNERRNTATDLPAPSAPSPTTNSSNPSHSGPLPATFDGFISTPPSPVLQNPDLLECTESTLPGPDTSSCWHFTPDDSGASLQHLFDADPLVAGLGVSEVRDNNSKKETDGMALTRQRLGAPVTETHVWMGRTEVETTEIPCPSAEKDTLLGVCTTCSLPSELMDTAVPTIPGYCGIFCNSEEAGDAAVGIPTACQDECDTFDCWREGTVTYQVTQNKLCEASPSLMGSLHLVRTSDMAQRSTKKRSLEMTRKQTQVEYTDTSSDDDRLVIEIEN